MERTSDHMAFFFSYYLSNKITSQGRGLIYFVPLMSNKQIVTGGEGVTLYNQRKSHSVNLKS